MRMETDRLVLRPWRVDDDGDIDALYRYASDPLIGPSAAWPVHRSREDSAQAIRGVLSEPETYAVVLKARREPVGSIGLKPLSAIIDPSEEENRDALEIGYCIGSSYWGRGLIPEAARALLRHAFLDLGMQSVWGTHDVANVQSSRVMDKLGMGVIRTRGHVHLALLGDIYRDETIRRITVEQWSRDTRSRAAETV
jgi:RimJ/RimL family protein N-acetyltransferase